MKFKVVLIMGFFSVAIFGAFFLAGCCKKRDSEPRQVPGPGEKAGAAVDKAIDKTEDAAKKFIDKTNIELREAASQAAEKTGEFLEKTGAKIEKSGADLKGK